MARMVLLLALVTSVLAIVDAPVAEASSISGVVLSVKAISSLEETPFTEEVASFTDSELGDTAGGFTATIDWGDATPATAATIVGSSGKFAISPGFVGHL